MNWCAFQVQISPYGGTKTTPTSPTRTVQGGPCRSGLRQGNKGGGFLSMWWICENVGQQAMSPSLTFQNATCIYQKRVAKQCAQPADRKHYHIQHRLVTISNNFTKQCTVPLSSVYSVHCVKDIKHHIPGCAVHWGTIWSQQQWFKRLNSPFPQL